MAANNINNNNSNNNNNNNSSNLKEGNTNIGNINIISSTTVVQTCFSKQEVEGVLRPGEWNTATKKNVYTSYAKEHKEPTEPHQTTHPTIPLQQTYLMTLSHNKNITSNNIESLKRLKERK